MTMGYSFISQKQLQTVSQGQLIMLHNMSWIMAMETCHRLYRIVIVVIHWVDVLKVCVIILMCRVHISKS